MEEKLTESYKIFRKNIVDIQSVSAKEAKIYIDHLRKAGLPFGEQLSEYYKKFAFPFIVFIVVFLSIGLTGKTKKNVLLISLASCISASVLFYVMHMVTMVFAKHGYISPFSGAWSPVILFTIASIILLKYSRT
jgi:lipopolysaccharide export system permease protein